MCNDVYLIKLMMYCMMMIMWDDNEEEIDDEWSEVWIVDLVTLDDPIKMP